MIEKTTLYEQVAHRILDRIAGGIYRKGEMLPCEKELTQEMGVSRVTVREALKRLAEMGAIETYKGKGSVVILDVEALEDTTESRERFRTGFLQSTKARLLLEPEIAREAAQCANEEDLKALEATLPGSGRYAARLMDEFHLVLAASVHNPPILRIMEDLLQAEAQMGPAEGTALTVPEQQKAIMREVGQQHRKIYEAVQEHNGEFAYFYMKEHLLYLMHCYEEYFNLSIGKEHQ